MTVEERRRDQFPVGMRVLAVDDDPTCLKLLETLLRRCQYHVTTTGQAVMALKMLREKKNEFDLVISDVHMPDMDGFKLLELVGLEMDLPVIMLSANGETSAVMKGITHGACDYLLKPVRIEELKNIWQHVVRRRKFDRKEHNSLDNGDDCGRLNLAIAEAGQYPATTSVSDQSGKLNRKRKDQNEDDEDDCDENDNDNEDPSTQKKPRVVWSVDLHRKFVAAVNQLGIDKAVPKRILDLMNVEGLTRENVASHLQKYRLYLKRISAVASQQANMVTALGGRDPSYLSVGSLNGFGNYHALMGSSQLSSLTSFQPSGILSQPNYTTGFGLRSLPPSGMVQFGRTQNNMGNPVNDFTKIQHVSLPVGLPGDQHGNVLQGMPASLGLDQLQQNKVLHDTNKYISGGFSGNGSTTNSLISSTRSPLFLQSNQQQTQSKVVGNRFPANLPSSSCDPFNMTAGSSHFCDIGRCNDAWQGAVPLTQYPTNNLPIVAPLGNGDFAPSNMAENISSIVPHIDSNSHETSSSSVIAVPLHDPLMGGDVQFQGNMLGGNMMLRPTGSVDDSNCFNFKSLSNCKQESENQKQDHTPKLNLLVGPLSSSMQNPPKIGPLVDNQSLSSGLDKTRMNMVAPTVTPFLTQFNRIDKSTADVKLKEEYTSNSPKQQGGFGSKDCMLDDLVNSVMHPDRDDVALIDGTMRCDIFSLDACL